MAPLSSRCGHTLVPAAGQPCYHDGRLAPLRRGLASPRDRAPSRRPPGSGSPALAACGWRPTLRPIGAVRLAIVEAGPTRTGDVAIVGGRILTGLLDVTSDVSALDGAGTWAVVLPFDGPPVCARFERVTTPEPGWPAGLGPGRAPVGPGWRAGRRASTGSAYAKGVAAIREAIAAGDVYQVNLCRRLSAPLPAGFDVLALGAALLHVPPRPPPGPRPAAVGGRGGGVGVARALPPPAGRRGGVVAHQGHRRHRRRADGQGPGRERDDRRPGAQRPGPGVRVRVGRGAGAVAGGVASPGLVHLVSTVRGRLRPGTGWAELLDATFPPGSVTGAPKLAALDVIAALEPVPRGVYCGAVGWVDADRREGDLNVAIRTFWVADGQLHLGTGGGITWDSDARRRVGGDRAQGPPAAGRRRRAPALPVQSMTHVWIDGEVLDADRGPGVALRPRPAHRRRRVRDAAGLPGASRSPPAATSSGWRCRPPAMRPAVPRRRPCVRQAMADGDRGQRPRRRAGCGSP